MVPGSGGHALAVSVGLRNCFGKDAGKDGTVNLRRRLRQDSPSQYGATRGQRSVNICLLFS